MRLPENSSARITQAGPLHLLVRVLSPTSHMPPLTHPLSHTRALSHTLTSFNTYPYSSHTSHTVTHTLSHTLSPCHTHTRAPPPPEPNPYPPATQSTGQEWDTCSALRGVLEVVMPSWSFFIQVQGDSFICPADLYRVSAPWSAGRHVPPDGGGSTPGEEDGDK